jgi:hypothetical protein
LGCAAVLALVLTVVAVSLAAELVRDGEGVDSQTPGQFGVYAGLAVVVWAAVAWVWSRRRRASRPSGPGRASGPVPASRQVLPGTGPVVDGQGVGQQEEGLPAAQAQAAGVGWVEYASALEEVLEGLAAVHAQLGSGPLPVYDSANRRFTVVPDPADGFVGLVSLSAALEPFIRGDRVVVRVSWSACSQPAPGLEEQAASDAREAVARANRVLAHHLGGPVASG